MSEIVFYVLLGAVLFFLETILVGGIWCIAGFLCCAWAVWLSYCDYGVIGAVLTIVASVILGISAFLVWLYVLPKTKFGKKIYLSTSQSGKASNIDFKSLVGKEGIAESALMPSGKVNIDGVLYEARSEFQHIDAGDKVKVFQADTFNVIVKKI
ncbi:MAG: hypothetical protein E7035_03750 [Verrucomicrobiaceae bacterium]|nr:hypothetical protein [Verrucomicrobiaceae bacterium]